MNSFITSGEDWLDTDGNLMEAHDAGILQVGGTYYLYGVDRTHNNEIEKDLSFFRLCMYSSKDLINWRFENYILCEEDHPDLSDPGKLIERPKILYNPNTGKYVMWFHYDNVKYGLWHLGVAVSDTVNGHYEYLGHSEVMGRGLADLALYREGNTGYLAATGGGIMHIYRLADDYLSAAEQLPDAAYADGKAIHGEAPSLFKKGGIYYMICSGFSGWAHNENFYCTAENLHGPWTERRDLTDPALFTFHSQNTYTLVVEGTEQTTYIYMGDRWDKGWVTSRYVWQPFKFDGDRMYLDYYHKWSIDVSTGKYSG